MLPALLALVLSAAPTPQAAAPADPPAQPSLATIMRQPDRVQIFLADMEYQVRFRQSAKQFKRDKRPRVGHFIFTKEGKALKAEDLQALAKSWVPPEEQKYREPTRCSFNPDIALRFWHGDTWVDSVVCLGCHQLVFFDSKAEHIAGGDFQDFRLLRKLATAAFPKEGFRE
jgi:hypothetical protein